MRPTIFLDMDDTLMETGNKYHQAKMDVANWISTRTEIPVAEILHEIDQYDHQQALHPHGFQKTRFPYSLHQIAWQYTHDQQLANRCKRRGEQVLSAQYPPFPWVHRTLRTLYPHVQILVVTKGDPDIQTRKYEDAELHITTHDLIVVPHKDPQTYQDILTTRGLTPEHTIMIGDSIVDDVNTPAHAGLRSIHITTKKPHWSYEHQGYTTTPIAILPDIRHVPMTLCAHYAKEYGYVIPLHTTMYLGVS